VLTETTARKKVVDSKSPAATRVSTDPGGRGMKELAKAVAEEKSASETIGPVVEYLTR
jgi:hypothetical protein